MALTVIDEIHGLIDVSNQFFSWGLFWISFGGMIRGRSGITFIVVGVVVVFFEKPVNGFQGLLNGHIRINRGRCYR